MDKLAIKLKDAKLAEKLRAAGFTNPRQLRNARDKDLLEIEGVGQAALDRIRAKFARSK